MAVIEIPDMKLQHVILRARRDAGLTQAEVAEKVGVSQPTVSKWERGKLIPNVFEMRRLAEVTDAGYLLDLRVLPTACIDELVAA